MARDRTKSPAERDNHKTKRSLEEENSESGFGSGSESEGKRKEGKRKSRSSKRRRKYDDTSSSSEESSGSDSEEERRRRKRKSRSSRRRTDTPSSSSSEEESGSESESKEERRRRKRRERKRREEKERERKRRRREKEKKEKKKEKKKKDKGKGAVTNSWGKYGIIKDTDMWNKRPEFTAWLAEVKQMNLESLPNWEEKQLFKDFMEDHNTATFPSKKYYNLDAYYKRQMEKENKKGMKKVVHTEMTVFNDEEIRRQEMQQVRERQKAEEVEALKRSMQSGMAQAMKEQAQLREEMLFQYKLGNLEAAAAIQRRLDPDVAM